MHIDELPVNRIITGDCREVMSCWPEDCIDFVMCSPPYWGLRNYGKETEAVWDEDSNCKHEWNDEVFAPTKNAQRGSTETKICKKMAKTQKGGGGRFCRKCSAWNGQLGLESNYYLYIQHLVEIGKIIRQILKPTGSWWLNLGDTYAGSGGAGGDWMKGSRAKEPKWKQGNSGSIKPKCKMLMPYRVALALIDDGWICRNDTIWQKCLAGNTFMLALLDGKPWMGMLKDLKRRFHNHKVELPTIDKDGNCIWIEIAEIYRKERGEAKKLMLTDGTSIITSKEHRFPVKVNPKFGKYIKQSKLMKVEELKEKYHRCLALNKIRIPHQDQVSLYDYDLGYLIGFYVAEGNKIYSRHGIQLSCGKEDESFIREIKKFVKERLGESIGIYRYGNVIHINIYSSIVESIIDKFISGKKAKDKHFTSKVLWYGENFIKGILDGYLDGDGHYEDSTDRWTGALTTNYLLRKQLLLLCKIIGYEMRLGKKVVKSELGEAIGYQIRKTEKGRKQKRNQYNDLRVQTIHSISNYGKVQLYDIEVKSLYTTYCGKGSTDKPTKNSRLKGWNQLFALPNGILTHNSNPMPSPVKDRLNTTTERIFHFVQQRKYYYDLDAIREKYTEPLNRWGGPKLKANGRSSWDEETGHSTYRKRDVRPNPKGKNPGDVIKMREAEHKDEEKHKSKSRGLKTKIKDPSRRIFSQEQYHGKDIECHPKGKNPGDVIKARGRKYKGRPEHSPGSRDWYLSEQRKNLPEAEKLVEYLREHKGELSHREIDEVLGYDGDCASHWFTYPNSKHGFSYPSKEDWWKLKELLSLDDTYDAQMTETELVPVTDEEHPKGKNPGDVIELSTKPFPEAHFATYPSDLCKLPIKSSCPSDGIVLDPMCGAGSTLIMAQRLGRKWIGIDISEKYCEMARKRISKECSHKLEEYI